MAQDLFGQIHVRGDHANLQFRHRRRAIARGINVFGQALETRLALSVADHRRAAGAIRLSHRRQSSTSRPKPACSIPGGSISMYGGSRAGCSRASNTAAMSARSNYFVTGDFLHDDIGIENPTGSFNPIHDTTDQERGFAFISGILDPTTRVIADPRHLARAIPDPEHAGPDPRSRADGQRPDRFRFVAAQREPARDHPLRHRRAAKNSTISTFRFCVQPLFERLFSAPTRSATCCSTASRRPPIAAASPPAPRATAATASPTTTRCAPAISSRASARPRPPTRWCIALNPDGSQVSDQPLSIPDSGGKTGWLYGLYLQDEWKIMPQRDAQFRRPLRSGRRIHPREPDQPAGQRRLGADRHDDDQAGYARYFTPPPFELIGRPTSPCSPIPPRAPPVTAEDPVKAERDHYFDIGADADRVAGAQGRDRRLLQDRQEPARRGPVRRADHSDAVQLRQGCARGAELSPATTSGTGRSTAISPRRRRRAKTSFQASSISSPTSSPISPTISSISITIRPTAASAGVAYTLPSDEYPAVRSVIYRQRAARQTPTVPNGNSLPDYRRSISSVLQKIDTGILKGPEAAARRDQPARREIRDPQRHRRRCRGAAIRSPAHAPRRADAAVLADNRVSTLQDLWAR